MNNSIEAKLKISAETAGAVKNLKDVLKSVTDLRERLKAAGGAAPFDAARKGVQSLGQQIAEAKAQLLAFAGIGAGLAGLRGVADLADAYSSMVARLRVATVGQLEFNAAQAQARTLAQQYQVPLRETAALYTRMLGAIRPLGGGLREAQVATEAMLAALKVSGATTQEAGSAILQFSQALGSGALRGEEFNAIAEAAPRLLDALAQGLGKPRDQLKSLAEQGELTTSAIIKALRSSLPQLQKEAGQIPATIGGALQGLRDAYLELIGKQADHSAGVAALVQGTNALAANLGKVATALTALVALFAAIKIGAFAAGFVQAAVGMASVAAATGPLLAGLRALWVLIGGPVGLVVALASLVVGWNMLSDAKAKSTKRSAETVRAERDAVARELEELAKARKAAGVGAGPSLANDAFLAQAKLNRLNAELKGLAREAEDLQRQAGGPRGNPGTEADLREPRTVADFEKENETRLQIVARYANKRRDYIIAKDKEIAAARLAGDVKLEQTLQVQKQGALDVQQKEEAAALRKFDAEVTLTRLATYKEHYDKLTELAADRNARELQLNQALFDQGLRDTKGYFAERARLEDAQSRQSLDKLEREATERQKVLARNQAILRRATTRNEQDAASEAVTQAQSDVDRVQAELEKGRRDAADKGRQRATDEQTVTREMAAQIDATDLQIKQANGLVTLADLRLQLERQYAKAREKEFAETGDTAQTDALIAAQLRTAELARLRDLLATATEGLRLKEADLDRQVSQGALTTEEAERRKIDARREELAQLDELIKKLEVVAKTDAERNAVAGLKQQVGGLREQATEVERTLRGSIKGGFATMFQDVVTGAETAGAAFRKFVAGVASSMLNLIAQRLGEKLVNELFPKEGSGGGGGFLPSVGSFLTNLFTFHQGGVVGAGGRPRAMPAGLVSSMAAYAPRYHSGGIVGLAPNEMPAILMKGEEVLTASDPRHRRNLGSNGMGPVNINVTVDGSGSGEAESRAAGLDLGRHIEIAVDAWALKNMRPGGLLAGG